VVRNVRVLQRRAAEPTLRSEEMHAPLQRKGRDRDVRLSREAGTHCLITETAVAERSTVGGSCDDTDMRSGRLE
jgi:hypothetical protein